MPREVAHKNDGESWADVVRDPTGASSADDKRDQTRIDDTATATQQSDVSNFGTAERAQRQVGGPQVFELELGESDGEEQPEGGEPPEPPRP